MQLDHQTAVLALVATREVGKENHLLALVRFVINRSSVLGNLLSMGWMTSARCMG